MCEVTSKYYSSGHLLSFCCIAVWTLTEIPTFFSVCNKSHDSCKIKLQFGWKMSLMSKKSEFSSQGCAIVRQCGEMKANVLGLGVLPRLTHHQLLDRDGAERSTAHHKQKNSQPLLKKGWRSHRFWTLQSPPQPCQHHDFYFFKKWVFFVKE